MFKNFSKCWSSRVFAQEHFKRPFVIAIHDAHRLYLLYSNSEKIHSKSFPIIWVIYMHLNIVDSAHCIYQGFLNCSWSLRR